MSSPCSAALGPLVCFSGPRPLPALAHVASMLAVRSFLRLISCFSRDISLVHEPLKRLLLPARALRTKTREASHTLGKRESHCAGAWRGRGNSGRQRMSRAKEWVRVELGLGLPGGRPGEVPEWHRVGGVGGDVHLSRCSRAQCPGLIAHLIAHPACSVVCNCTGAF